MAMIESIKNSIHKFINRGMGTILIYHSVVDVPLKFDLWTHMPVSLFDAHMALLARECRVVSLKEMVDGVREGRIPKNAVAVTLDDGFRNNYTRAYPILKKYRIPATIFLSTGFTGSETLLWPERVAYQFMRTECTGIESDEFGKIALNDSHELKRACKSVINTLKQYNHLLIDDKVRQLGEQLKVAYLRDDPLFKEWLPLNKEEIRKMSREGLVSFGGHAVDHAILTRHSDEEVKRQITNCRNDLDALLSEKTVFWAHPNGGANDFNEWHEAQLQLSGFSAIFTAIPDYVDADAKMERVGRIGIGSNVSPEELLGIIAKRNYLSSYSRFAKIGALCRGIFA